MAAAGAMPAGAQVPWELATSQLTASYQALEISSLAGPVPVAPIELSAERLVIAIPASVAPWLPNSLVTLGDPVDGSLSADGFAVAVVVVVLASNVAAAFELHTVHWPAAEALDQLSFAASVPVPLGAGPYEWISLMRCRLLLCLWALTSWTGSPAEA